MGTILYCIGILALAAGFVFVKVMFWLWVFKCAASILAQSFTPKNK